MELTLELGKSQPAVAVVVVVVVVVVFVCFNSALARQLPRLK